MLCPMARSSRPKPVASVRFPVIRCVSDMRENGLYVHSVIGEAIVEDGIKGDV